MKVAILVDGGFFLRRAEYLWGYKSPQKRAEELVVYCKRHLKDEHIKNDKGRKDLYRIFYYDCIPSDKTVFHPLLKKQIELKKTEMYRWNNTFFDELKSKRKVAIRRGELLESAIGYTIKPDVVKKLCRRDISLDDLTEDDFKLDIQQKGVDTRICLDIASLAYKKQVDQIVLIAGDSDFVPAAKHARREGIDFILDPMWHTIKPSLNEHIDGLQTKVHKPTDERIKKDPLYVKGKTNVTKNIEQ